MIRTVFFDVGDTLIYTPIPPDDIFLLLCAENGLQIEPQAAAQARAEAFQCLGPFLPNYRGRSEEYWLRYDAQVLDLLGIPDPDGRLAAAICEGFQRNWQKVFDDARPTLETLHRQGYNLGIVSNAEAGIERVMRQLGLTPLVDYLTYSEEVGVEKPDPRIFKIALGRAGCRADEALHIGNDYQADVVGARTAGLTPILLDRNDHYPEADCLRVRSLSEIEGMLRQLVGRS
jgi:putative hydrolase of the HAD superfamily